MPTLIARKPHRYNGQLWRKGQAFIASAADALVLKAIGVAMDDTEPKPAVEPPTVKRPRGRPRKVQTTQTYETREMVAAEPAAEPTEPIDDTPVED